MRFPTNYLIITIAALAMIVCVNVCAAPQSFETDAIEGWIASAGSSVSASTAHFKDGAASMRWDWKSASTLSYAVPAAFDKPSGVVGWIYNEKPVEGQFTFRFGTPEGLAGGSVPYAFTYDLNFTGWRWCCVRFEYDSPVEGYAGDKTVNAMTITAPENVSGSTFFDLVEFPDYILWSRGATRQTPYINPTRDHNWHIRFDDAARAATPPATVSADELAGLKTIQDRYVGWLTAEGADWEHPMVKARLETFLGRVRWTKDALPDLISKPVTSQNPVTGLWRYLAVAAVGYVTDAPGNEFYRDPVLRDRIIAAFNYLNEQGWAAGSLFGDARVFTLMTGGYGPTVLLMKPELQAAGIWERELETLRWYSCIGSTIAEHDVEGRSADEIRARSLLMLCYVLCLDEGPEKVMWLHALSNWESDSLRLAPGFGDTIKPDFTGFHHQMVIGNSYVIDALHTGAIATYMLHDTPFALTPEAHRNVRNALLAARTYSNKYDIPHGMACRWPFGVTSLYELVPAYAYIAEAHPEPDMELAAAFKRLWDPDSEKFLKAVTERSEVGFSYRSTLGAAVLMSRLTLPDVVAESSPEGNWFFPYAGMTVHRRDDWMVAIKGWSKYIRNFESQPIRGSSRGQNLYGRYMSNGVVDIYGSGDPVTAAASGYLVPGWDWNRWPGATAIYLPWLDLYQKEAYGRDLNNETFVGGVASDDDGLFSMVLADPVNAPGFRAQKTYFCIGNRIICLGSGITSADTVNPVETTLFQRGISDVSVPSFVNSSTPITDLPYTFDGVAGQSAWMGDHLGNFYYVPDAASLHYARHRQSAPNEGVIDELTEGDVEVAWFDHGAAPSDASYEYVTLVQSSIDEVTDFARAPGYEVLRHDNRAHIITVPSMHMTGYALFEAGPVEDAAPVVATDVPCMIIIRGADAGLQISVADPDLGWTEEDRRSHPRTVRLTLYGTWSIPDEVTGARVIKVVPNGNPPGGDAPDANTIIEVTCGDGRTTEFPVTGVPW